VRLRIFRWSWRWPVVAAGTAVLCALPVLASALPVSVPSLTAAQLRTRILASQSMSFAGYAESNATFGLPPLGAFSSVASLLDGTTKMQVWQASPQRWRVDVIADASERDTYSADAATQYTWDSQQELMTAILGQQTIRLPVAADLVAPSLAVRLIKEAGTGARLSLLQPQRVAGQAAAGLRLVPSDPASTVGEVDIWANPVSGLPLLVDIIARGGTRPALQTQFFQVSAWRPDPAILTPRRSPGSGFTVTTANAFSGELSHLLARKLPGSLDGRTLTATPVPGADVYGSGLAPFAVLAIRARTDLLIDDAVASGATPFQARVSDSREPRGDMAIGASASAPLVNLVLVQENHSPVTYLLAGLVTRTVLMKAALELVAAL
jgi:hypothetical protein